MNWYWGVGIVFVAGALAAATSLADRDVVSDEWRRFWAPGEQGKARAFEVGVHFLAGASMALTGLAFNWLPAADDESWKVLLNGVFFGAIGESVLRAEVNVELGAPGQSVLRRAIRGVAKRADVNAEAAVKRLIRAAKAEALWTEVYKHIEVAHGSVGGHHYEVLMDNLVSVFDVLEAGPGNADRQDRTEAEATLARTAQQLFITERRTIDGFTSVADAMERLAATPPDRRRQTDRRTSGERRTRVDLRDPDRRSGKDRRAAKDRRSGVDRRVPSTA